MTVVMVLVGILSAVAVLTLTRATGNRPRIAARMLHRDLTYARQRAMATGLGVWVVFNTGAESWKLLEEDPASLGRTDANPIIDQATNADFVQTLGTGQFVGVGIDTAVFDAGTEVGFTWDGQPLNATEALLAVQGVVTLTDGSQVTVEVDTGYAYYAP